jgi:hypothetical protein
LESALPTLLIAELRQDTNSIHNTNAVSQNLKSCALEIPRFSGGALAPSRR